MKSIITATQLSKRFGEACALDDVSFAVERAEIFGFIGADGAGKSTLFNILTTLQLADQGSATIAGYDVVLDFRILRRIIGYMPGTFSLYPDLSVQENLQFFARVFGTTIQQNYHLIADIYRMLKPFKQRRAGALSGGMKQKLALCCALIRNPQLLILDEPTTGVDPVSRAEFWENLRSIKDQDITVVVSTPYMDEAMQCDRVALIHHGHIMTIDTPQAVLEAYPHSILAIGGARKNLLLRAIRTAPHIINAYAFGEYIHAVVTHDASSLAAEQLSTHLQAANLEHSITHIKPEFEDCFLHYMGAEHE